MSFKQSVYQQFQQVLAHKILTLQQQLADLRTSTANETKSTVGDKYETARALLQNEQDMVRKKIQEALEQEILLRDIDIEVGSSSIRSGSLVKTNHGWFFICIALGKITASDNTVMAISTISPLGKLLIGQIPGNTIMLNNKAYQIEAII
jgi:superfamily II RNA helicase